MKINLLIAAISLCSASAFAGDCSVKIAREACAGKETEAFKPYGGKKETVEPKSVADEAACMKHAESQSKIVRKGTLSAKKVTATFDGKDLGKTFEDKKDCK